MRRFLESQQMVLDELAKRLKVPRSQIERLADEASLINVDTALRLSRFFGLAPQFWQSMQYNYDVACATIDIGCIQPLERDVV